MFLRSMLCASALLWAGGALAADLPKGISAGPTYAGVSEYRLANGLTVLLYPDASKPRTLVNVTYLVGSKHENYGETGMAHLLEHLVFKGTPDFPDIDAGFNRYGMRSNGTTSADRTNYFETFEANPEALAWALKMEASRMTQSFIAKKDLDSEMTVVRNEMERGETEPFRVSFKNLLSLAYQWHNYGNDTIGARADVENVPIERLQAFYRTWYQPDTAVLLVAGAFEPAPTLDLIAREFGRIPKPERSLPALYTREPAQDGAREATVRRIAGTPLLLAGYHTPGAAHPESPAVRLLGIVLGDEQTGRLRAALVEQGLAAAAGTFAWDNQESGMLMAYAQLTKDQALPEARAALLQALESLADAPITDAEFQRAQVKYRNQMKSSLDDVSQLGIFLSEYIAAGDWRLFFWEQQQVETLDVAAVNAVAQRYLREVNRTLVNFEPAKSIERVEIAPPPAVTSVLESLKPDSVAQQGESFELTPAEIERRTTRVELRPGLQLAMLPKQTRNQVVNVQLKLNYGDEQSLRGQNEAAAAFGGLLMRGTQRLDRVAFDDALEQLEAEVSAGAGSGGVSIRVRTTRAHLAATLDLVVEALRTPKLDAQEFETWRKETLAGFDYSENDPQARAFERIGEIGNPYPADHPRGFVSRADRRAAIAALKLEAVQAFHARYISAASASAGLVGDFDPAAVQQQLTEALGQWTATQAPYTRIPDRLNTARGEQAQVDTPDQANGAMAASLAVPINDSHPDYPALLIGNHVLGAGGLDSRLPQRLREKEGWSYGAGSWFNVGIYEDVGSFGAYAIAAPENLLKVRHGLQEELERLLRDGITAEEFSKAQDGWLKGRRVGWADDARLAGMLQGQAEVGRSMRESEQLEAAVAALTREVVNTALRTHLSVTDWNIVLAGDPAKMQSESQP